MHTLPVHPSGLMYSQIFLRPEPLGVERVAAVAEVASIREPGVFIVDDAGFIRPELGHVVAAELEALAQTAGIAARPSAAASTSAGAG